jgi:hypothetical protein
MPVRTRIDRSGTRVRGEREVVDAEFDAIDEVVDRVGDPSTESARWAAGGAVAAGGGLVRAGSATGERRRTGRTVLAGTIRPHGAADVADAEPRLGTTREAFTDAVAVALAPTTAASLAPELERAGLAEAGSRRSEAAASRGALGRQEAHLDRAAGTVDDVVAWIVDANGTPSPRPRGRRTLPRRRPWRPVGGNPRRGGSIPYRVEAERSSASRTRERWGRPGDRAPASGGESHAGRSANDGRSVRRTRTVVTTAGHDGSEREAFE